VHGDIGGELRDKRQLMHVRPYAMFICSVDPAS